MKMKSLRQAVVLAFCVSLASPLLAGQADQRAADYYARGVFLIQQGQYRDGARWVREALKRGAAEPNEAQGSESRFMVRRYDPYYWLGVAEMELGLPELALASFEWSLRAAPGGGPAVITRWQDEYCDLKKRKALLEQQLRNELPQVDLVSSPGESQPSR